MCFQFLDDFQDPVKGGICGLVNGLYDNHHKSYSVNATEDETELVEQPTDAEPLAEPVGLEKFDSNNHVLQWMVRA